MYLANPLRMLRQEQLQAVQLLRDALDVIETIHSNDDFAAGEALLKLLDTVLHFRLLEVLKITRGQMTSLGR